MRGEEHILYQNRHLSRCGWIYIVLCSIKVHWEHHIIGMSQKHH